MKFKLNKLKNLYRKFFLWLIGTKYFIGNWKMFGIPSSFKIIERIQQIYK